MKYPLPSRVLSMLAALILSIACAGTGNGGSSDAMPSGAAGPFEGNEGCFRVERLDTGEVIAEIGAERCRAAFEPCSTIKVALLTLAFDRGVLRDAEQSIPWDGRVHSRNVLNQDQTAKSYIAYSVNWVSDWIVESIGSETVAGELKLFGFAPAESASSEEGDDTTVSFGTVLSPLDQISFWRNLWLGRLPVSDTTSSLVRKSVYDRAPSGDAKLYGKTGTCCIDPHCQTEPGRQLAWYVGVLETGGDSYVFALNIAESQPLAGYAGGRARDLAISFLEELELIRHQ